jgi:GPH family glycoside/pentoside/hexuronide:cation symporter
MLDKITWKEKAGYGLGDAASSMFWKIFGMYLLFFYTDVYGIPAAVVGTMFLVTRVWDSCFDPVVGILADRTETRWGKFRPYLFWVAIPFGLIGVLTFYTPDANMTSKIIYAYVTYSLMMMVYSLINVPYASLLGVMSADGKERTTLSSYRMVFAFGGSLLALWLIEPLVRYFGRGNMTSQHGWLMTMVVFSLITTAFFWGCFSLTRERIQPIKEKSASLKVDVKDLLSNKPWWILLGAGVAALIFNSIRDGGAVYYFKYYVQTIPGFNLKWGFIDTSLSLTTLYLVLGQASNIVGVILATPFANRFGKKNTYLGAMFLAAVLSVLFYAFHKTDIVPILVFQCLISICAGCIFPLLWSMYADTADYSEWKKGRRATGLIFSSSSMSQKFGWTIGGATTGWLLGYYGFHANAIQSDATQTGIRWMLSILPAIGAVLSVLFISVYPLSEQKLERITKELTRKRELSTNVEAINKKVTDLL